MAGTSPAMTILIHAGNVILRCERSASKDEPHGPSPFETRPLGAPQGDGSNQLSRNDRSFRLLDGCFNFRSALASI